MKHKFSFFLKFNAWIWFVVGGLLVILSFTKSVELSPFAISSFYFGVIILVIDYVIQLIFDSKIYLKNILENRQSKTSEQDMSHKINLNQGFENKNSFDNGFPRVLEGENLNYFPYIFLLIVAIGILVLFLKRFGYNFLNAAGY